MPMEIVPDSIEPTKLGAVVMKIFHEGKRLMDEGRWDSDKGRMRE